MPSQYIIGDSDKALYGIPNATDNQIIAASIIIDGYLKRPEGLVWVPDAKGNPCYMKGLTSPLKLTTTQAISPGQNVNVNVTGPVLTISTGSSQCGLVAIIDRENDDRREAVIVNAINTNNTTITLTNVQFAHDVGSVLEFYLVIYEERQMPKARPITNVSRTPALIMLAAQGRYGFSRRGNAYYQTYEYNLLSAASQFGGPPIWEMIDQTLIGVDPTTGMVWSPSGIFLAYFTEIRFSYIAGWTYESLPSAVKMACASIVKADTSIPMNGAIRSYRAGDTAIDRFSATYLTDDVKLMLEPFRARELV